jgi:hypothetical protein
MEQSELSCPNDKPRLNGLRGKLRALRKETADHRGMSVVKQARDSSPIVGR